MILLFYFRLTLVLPSILALDVKHGLFVEHLNMWPLRSSLTKYYISLIGHDEMI